MGLAQIGVGLVDVRDPSGTTGAARVGRAARDERPILDRISEYGIRCDAENDRVLQIDLPPVERERSIGYRLEHDAERAVGGSFRLEIGLAGDRDREIGPAGSWVPVAVVGGGKGAALPTTLR